MITDKPKVLIVRGGDSIKLNLELLLLRLEVDGEIEIIYDHLENDKIRGIEISSVWEDGLIAGGADCILQQTDPHTKEVYDLLDKKHKKPWYLKGRW